MDLLRPNLGMLPGYVDALERGWAADNTRGAAGIADELASIRADPQAFITRIYDPEGAGPPVAMPDGSRVPRLPGYRLWMWDGDFCGSIGFRWQPGTAELPPYVLGHIGYGVVQKVMLANGAVFVERFTKTAHHGGGESLRFRIALRG